MPGKGRRYAASPKQQKMMAIRKHNPSKSNHPEIPMQVAKELDRKPPGGYKSQRRVKRFERP